MALAESPKSTAEKFLPWFQRGYTIAGLVLWLVVWGSQLQFKVWTLEEWRKEIDPRQVSISTTLTRLETRAEDTAKTLERIEKFMERQNDRNEKK